MALLSESLVLNILGIIVAIIGGLLVYLKFVLFNYWSSRNIESIKPVIPYGSLKAILTAESSFGEFFRDGYMKFKKRRLFGAYTLHKPMLVVTDPDLIRIILTKDFSHFHDRGMYSNEQVDPLSGHLFLLPGTRWKYLRTKFSPTFTSSKMKQMFFTVEETSRKLADYVKDKAKESELIEVKDLLARFSTDVIASAAFGIECNSLKNPDAEFRHWGRKFFEPKPLIQIVANLFPPILKLLRIHTVDVNVSNFFINAFNETVKYRTENKVVRNDFMELVMQLMDKGYLESDEGAEPQQASEEDSKKITMLEGAAQAFVFWLAGFETSSTTATHCLYELALHQDIQDKLAEEINEVLKQFGGVTYESLKKMPYLHKVVSETLRKYPPLPILNRQCTESIDLPGTGLRVEKGTDVIIPIFGLHSDPDIYPDPETFDPERFSEENIASRHPYAYLAFGEGPRNCIGLRFGLIQTKVGLISLLSKYRFRPGPNMKVPFDVDKRSFIHCPDGGILLRIENRSTMGPGV